MVIVKKRTTTTKGNNLIYAFCNDCKLAMSIKDIDTHKCRYEYKETNKK